MLTLKQILLQFRLGDWFLSVDLKDAYFHIHIAPQFLRVMFEWVAYQNTVLPFELSQAPCMVAKCMDTVLFPLIRPKYWHSPECSLKFQRLAASFKLGDSIHRVHRPL